MTENEKALRFYCSRVYTENTLTSVQAAGLESIAENAHGAVDWATVWAVLTDIMNRYNRLEHDLQTAAGMADDEKQVTD